MNYRRVEYDLLLTHEAYFDFIKTILSNQLERNPDLSITDFLSAMMELIEIQDNLSVDPAHVDQQLLLSKDQPMTAPHKVTDDAIHSLISSNSVCRGLLDMWTGITTSNNDVFTDEDLTEYKARVAELNLAVPSLNFDYETERFTDLSPKIRTAMSDSRPEF